MSPRSALPLRLEYMLLGLIRRRPAHGYELLQRWNEPGGIGMVWRVKPGLLYAALEKLEAAGLLDATLIPGETSPPRREYRITPDGERCFLDWMKTPVPAPREFRQDFLVRLFFFEDVDPALVEDLTARQREVSRRWLASLQKQMGSVNEFELKVLAFRCHQVKDILDWLDELAAATGKTITKHEDRNDA